MRAIVNGISQGLTFQALNKEQQESEMANINTGHLNSDFHKIMNQFQGQMKSMQKAQDKILEEVESIK